MNKFFTTIILGVLSLCVNAQSPSTAPSTEPFGKINKSDLELKACDFEKDANAEVLFDKGKVSFSSYHEMFFERHIRIKIFNEKGNAEANIRIPYWGGLRLEYISEVQAETINLNNGSIQFSKVEKKSFYTENLDKYRTELVLSFPDVKPGCVIELKYKLTIENTGDFPDWYFQREIPTRYSEITTLIPQALFYKQLAMVTRPFITNTDEVKSMVNVPSLHDEPFMSSRRDNLERIFFEQGSVVERFDTWQNINDVEVDDIDFGGQFKRKLEGEEIILNKAKTIKADDDKIAYIFNEVKKRMKWNETDERYTNDGTREAWEKKTGNSTEINLALYHLLQKAGLKAFPMLVSSKDHGKVNPSFPSYRQFDKTVAYIPVDSNKFYVLDATNKYNIYNEMPSSLLNRFGLSIDKDKIKFDMVFLEKPAHVKQVAVISAEIKPDGKLSGTAQLNSFGYYRIDALKKYKTDGEKKYIDYLENGDNNLKISAVKFENMEVDTLPLTQNIDFKMNLAGSDETYIYFNPNLFISRQDNQFLSENRYTDIEFGYRKNYSSNGIYKEPAGYKIDAMPKSVTMTTSDKSISFKRIIAEQDGMIVVRFLIDYNKSVYFKEGYPELHEFFKKMNEMMNEQVVFKKSS